MSCILVDKEIIFNMIDKVNQMQIEIAELNNQLMALYGRASYESQSNLNNSARNQPFDFVKIISDDKGSI